MIISNSFYSVPRRELIKNKNPEFSPMPNPGFYLLLKTLLLAVTVKCHCQILSDDLSRTTFNVVTLQEVHQLAVFEQGDRR